MTLEKISKQLKDQNSNLPPVESWDPPYCGEMDLLIKTDGSWFYHGSVINRLALVKLFASVLKKEQQDYFLVTPVEKIKIQVANQPFVITNWQWLENCLPATMQITTNLGDTIIVNQQHPIEIDQDGNLSILVRRNLAASIHRNVFYQWVELAHEVNNEKCQQLVITSAGINFIIGEY